MADSILEKELVVRVLSFLVLDRGFPRSIFGLEKKLSYLSKISTVQGSPPSRRNRCDIVAFGKNRAGELSPILLIECKRCDSKLKDGAIQLVAYNYYLKALFIGVATPNCVEITSTNTQAREALSKSPLLFPSNTSLGMPWWSGIPTFSWLEDKYKELS